MGESVSASCPLQNFRINGIHHLMCITRELEFKLFFLFILVWLIFYGSFIMSMFFIPLPELKYTAIYHDS